MKKRNYVVRILYLLLKALNVIRLIGVVVDWFVDGIQTIQIEGCDTFPYHFSYVVYLRLKASSNGGFFVSY